MKLIGDFNKHGKKWHYNVSVPDYAGYEDDKKAMREAFKEAMRAKGKKDELQFLQQVRLNTPAQRVLCRA